MDNIALIVAIDKRTRGIGKGNRLLFDIPEDMAYFRTMTKEKTVVFGYHTYLSLPKRPLPKRVNIVLTRKDITLEGATVLHSIEDLLTYAKVHAIEEIMICGGDSIYMQCLPYVKTAYVTEVESDVDVESDTFFPLLPDGEWKLEKKIWTDEGKKHQPKYSFCTYIRK